MAGFAAMRNLLKRLILWAIEPEASEYTCRTIAEQLKLRDEQIHAQEQAWIECANDINKLKEQIGTRPEPQPTIRRAANFGAFRAAAETPVRK